MSAVSALQSSVAKIVELSEKQMTLMMTDLRLMHEHLESKVNIYFPLKQIEIDEIPWQENKIYI